MKTRVPVAQNARIVIDEAALITLLQVLLQALLLLLRLQLERQLLLRPQRL